MLMKHWGIPADKSQTGALLCRGLSLEPVGAYMKDGSDGENS